jgi:hypothetical protein
MISSADARSIDPTSTVIRGAKLRERGMSNVTSKWALAGLVGAVLFSIAAPAEAKMCRWFGTSPICEGSCPRGWKATKFDSCFSGFKVYCCERTGSTTSDGGGSPYTPSKNRPPKPQGPVVSSNNRFICEQNCPYPTGSSMQAGCIQNCLNRLANRGRR